MFGVYVAVPVQSARILPNMEHVVRRYIANTPMIDWLMKWCWCSHAVWMYDYHAFTRQISHSIRLKFNTWFTNNRAQMSQVGLRRIKISIPFDDWPLMSCWAIDSQIRIFVALKSYLLMKNASDICFRSISNIIRQMPACFVYFYISRLKCYIFSRFLVQICRPLRLSV